MMLKTTILAYATSYLAILGSAQVNTVPEKCLSKLPLVGTAVDGSVSFDQTQDIVDKMPVGFTPIRFNICIELDGKETRLRSVEQTFSNDIDDFTLSKVGPAVSEICSVFDWDDRQFPSQAQVFSEGEEITSVTFVNTETFQFEQFGTSVVPTKETVTFEDDQKWLGFYGQQNDSVITQLGMIVMSQSCVAEQYPEDPKSSEDTRVENFNSDSPVKQEVETNVLAIVLVVLAILIVIGTIIAVCVCQSKRKDRSVSKVNVLEGSELKKMPAGPNSSAVPQETDLENNQEVLDTNRANTERQVFTKGDE